MKSILTMINNVDKENLYEYYIETTHHPLPYEKITRKKMMEHILDYYNDEDRLLYTLSKNEIEILKKIIEKENVILEENKLILQSLSKKYIIDYSFYFNDVVIYNEFYDIVERMLEQASTSKGQKFINLQQVSIGICNAYGILTKEEFYNCIYRYIDDIDQEEIDAFIIESQYFNHCIALLEITYDNRPVVLYTYKDVELVADFLDMFINVLALPKYEFSYEEIITYANYGINYKNPSLQRLLQCMKAVDTYFFEDLFLEAVFTNVNLLLDKNNLKKIIYEIYPHYKGNVEQFFELLDLCDEVAETLNTWAARGYPANRMSDILGDLHLDVMKKLETAYHYKTGLLPEEDLTRFLEFVENTTEEELDEYIHLDDKKHLN